MELLKHNRQTTEFYPELTLLLQIGVFLFCLCFFLRGDSLGSFSLPFFPCILLSPHDSWFWTFKHVGESSGWGCSRVYHSVSVWLGQSYIFWYLSLLIWKRSSRFKTSTIVQLVESWFVVVWREQGMVSQHCLETNMHNFYLSDPFAHPLPASFIAKVDLIRKNRAIYF